MKAIVSMVRYLKCIMSLMLIISILFGSLTTVEAATLSQTEKAYNTADSQDDPMYYKEMQKQADSLMMRSFSGQNYTHNSRYDGYEIREGIDVSYYQGDIDWNAVKNSGVKFVFIRVGYRGYGSGQLCEDSRYWQYIQGATAVGLDVGVYVFSQAVNEDEAREEARYIVNHLNGYKITLPIVMDYEYASGSSGAVGRLYDAHLSKEAATNNCNAFANEARAYGYQPMIYANKTFLENSVNANAINAQIWLANYTTKTKYTGEYTFWQYSSAGYVQGINSRIDSNFWYVDPQSVANGTYTVRSALNTNLCMDVKDISQKDGVNVQIWSNNSYYAAQDWVFEYVGAGKYTIKSLASGKYLDVENGGTAPGTNVWQYSRNDTDSQKWYLRDAGSGYYYIVSARNGLYLDVSNANASNGANLQVWSANGNAAQKFTLWNSNYCQTISDGVYAISMSTAPNLCLDVSGGNENDGANAQIWSKNGTSSQEWKITYVGDGKYTIRSSKSGKYLDVAGSGNKNGTNVQLWSGNGAAAQKWYIKSNGHGGYFIVSACSGLALDVQGGQLANGTNVQTWSSNSVAAQQYSFQNVGSGQVISNGMYILTSAVNNNKAIDIASGSRDDGANVQLWDSNSTIAQKYRINYVGSGAYTIQSVKSGKYLDVSNGGQDMGTNVQQWNGNGSNAQKWYLKDAGNGYYYFISACNGLYLDIENGSMNAGTNIRCWTGNESDAQKFRLLATQDVGIIADGTYTLASAINSHYVLDVSNASDANEANIQLWEDNGTSAQKFAIHYLGGDIYEIKTNCGKNLDVAGGSKQPGANLQQFQSNGTAAQRWYINGTGNGTYSIQSVSNGLFLDAYNAQAYSGNNVQLWTGNGWNCQKYYFIQK